MLSEDEMKEAKKTSKLSVLLYRFGDGRESKSLEEIVVPVSICGKNLKVAVDVVKNNIPLLIGRPTMLRLGMIIDTKKHEVKVDGHTFKMPFNAAGHYSIPICEWTKEECHVVLHLEHLEKASKQEKRKKALKLHRQFTHALKKDYSV